MFTYFAYPHLRIILIVYLRLGKSLGLNKYQRLTKIGLPIVRPALAGVSFVIMETLAEYATMEYFGVPTFATGIFRAWFVLGDESALLDYLLFF